MFNAMIYATMRPDNPDSLLWGGLKLQLQAQIPNGHGMGVAYTPSAAHIFASAHSYYLNHGHQLRKGKSQQNTAQPRGAVSVEPADEEQGDDEHTHENGVDPEDANIFWNQGERYSRFPAVQASPGASANHRPSNRRSAPSHDSKSK